MKIMLWKHGINDGSQDELPHIGVGILAKDIKDAGHNVFIADHHFDFVDVNVAISLLEIERPDILGVSMVSTTGFPLNHRQYSIRHMRWV